MPAPKPEGYGGARRLIPAVVATAAVLACAPGCLDQGAARWELVSLPVERPGFPADLRIDYVKSNRSLSGPERDAVLQGMLIPGMKAEDVLRIAGEPERRIELPPDVAVVGGPVEEWIYPEWSRVRGGPAAPGMVYVSDGVVIDFIAVEPSGRIMRRPARGADWGVKSSGSPGILP